LSYQDKSITCRDCGQSFAFTASEQQFFAEKGFTNEPKRCPNCRRAKRDSTSATQGGQRTW
jgi:N-acetylglutamate synthase-like GNAT family acetyltransferase